MDRRYLVGYAWRWGGAGSRQGSCTKGVGGWRLAGAAHGRRGGAPFAVDGAIAAGESNCQH